MLDLLVPAKEEGESAGVQWGFQLRLAPAENSDSRQGWLSIHTAQVGKLRVRASWLPEGAANCSDCNSRAECFWNCKTPTEEELPVEHF